MYQQNQFQPQHVPQNANMYPTQMLPPQLTPIRHIVKKNTIVHVVPHFHPCPCIYHRRKRF